MIRTKLARAGATVLPLALLALIATNGDTKSLSVSSPLPDSCCQHSVSERVNSDAALTSSGKDATQLIAQRPSSRGQSSADYLDDCSEEGIYHWPAEKLPIKVFMENGTNVPGYRANFPQILANGFDAWVTATNGRLGWVQVRDKSQADLVVSWTTSTPEHENGTEAGRTKTFTKFDTTTNHGKIYKATMALATRLPDREMSDEEVTKTFMHECGHAFGIAGHSPNRVDIMCAKVNHSQQPVLSKADVATIVRLYGSYPACAAVSPKNSSPTL